MSFELLEYSSYVLMLIVSVLIISPILFVLFLRLEFYLKLWLKARDDYNNARGTIHLKILKRCLRNLQLKIKETEKELEILKQYKEEIAIERLRELKKAATIYLINSEFTSIPGVGPILRDRVMKECFNGTLESLYRASMVHGIGEERARAICAWVNNAERRLPQILKGNFPRKKKINRKYDALDEEASRRIIEMESLLKQMLKLERKALHEIASLEKVKISTFFKSYKGDEEASRAVTNYLLGCFPKWRRTPDWFRVLVENYGKTS